MNHDAPAYGLWGLAFINAAIFIMFAFSFFKPKTKRDWRTFSTFSAFLVALFAEMYGFPLTIYLLSGWLQSRFPGTDFLSHDAGHIWYSLLGFKGDPHLTPIHLASNILIAAGFIGLSASWRVLLKAQQEGDSQPRGRTHTFAIRSTSGLSSSCSVSCCNGRHSLPWPCFPCS